MVAGGALLLGCPRSRAPASAPNDGHPHADSALDGGGAADLRDFAQVHRRELDERLRPAFGQFLAHEQIAPRGFAPFRDAPSVMNRLHSARMFAFGYGARTCGESVLQQDGTICEGAVYPGALLTQSQTARASELFRAATRPVAASRDVAMCFEPHHSIVFFDERSTPIAEMTVCFECGNFRLAPGLEGEAGMTETEGNFIADTCRALSVGGCPPGGTFRMPPLPQPAEDLTLTMGDLEERRRHVALAAPHGVKEDVRLANLPLPDRKVLCAWLAGAWHRASGDFECEDGRGLRVDAFDACAKPVSTRCEATVRDFVVCTRARIGTLCGSDPPECARMDACKKGVVLRYR